MTSELDPLDERLAAAGRLRELDPDARQALQDLVEAAAPRGGRRGVRRLLVPASVGAGALVLATAGAVAATQWGPWTYVPEPDIVIARDWTAVDGSELGSCRTHLVTENLDDDTLAAARAYFAGLDVDAVEPDAEHVASMLTGAGRPERLGELIEGADVDDYDVTHTGPIWTDAFLSDAWILQSGLTTAVYKGLSERLAGDDPELVDTLSAHMENQCTTDPPGSRG